MANRLAQESSPYLRQHADNPVDWYPWGDEALRRAREEDRPILLSIGYSACHWCHVMAHESFEDPGIAELMNAHFINVKVDREERPDLDQIYQTAHAMLAQRPGGWPLTMFLTPEQVPFFGGTYFPKQSRYGLPGFGELLQRIHQFYREHAEDIASQNAALLDALRQNSRSGEGAAVLSEAPLEEARRQVQRLFDPVHGGFGGAPKFPHPADLALLLRMGAWKDDEGARNMACFTLRRMADGGLYDQVGGGFYRYSVDAEWMIPHFEKMLYDNGTLLALYSDAYLACADARFAAVAEETVAWLLREMRAPEGGFYAALDADAAGREGSFYVWTPQQAQALLTPEEYALASRHYGLDRKPNFEDAEWHLHVVRQPEDLAREMELDLDIVNARLREARRKLFAARGARVRPGLDDKLLTSWNALVIHGLARAGIVFARPDWIAAAQAAVDFIRGHLWDGKRLLAVHARGTAKLNAYLDDYAFLLNALLELLQAAYRAEDLRFARELADALLLEFEDPDGGFFFTGHGHEQLIQRPKSVYDSAMPSGNGVAAFALQRLGHLLGEARYLQAAERTLQAFGQALTQNPGGAMSLAIALAEYVRPPRIVILRGEGEALRSWREAFQTRYRPFDLVLALPNDAEGLPAALDKPAGRPVGAWICQNMSCSPEITALDDALRA